MSNNIGVSPKALREAQEAFLQYQSRQESMLDKELIEDKLSQLLIFIDQLEGTSAGAAEIRRRVRLFGVCKRGDGESAAEFYSKLRRWLDRDMPQIKSPLHAPRQTHCGPTS
jgi:hypothetical protein